MTIRTKLLVFIPLLVLLVNSVTFFLFESGKIVQMSYGVMMDRILLYNQSAQTAEDNLRLLHAYLLNPGGSGGAELEQAQAKLQELRAGLARSTSSSLQASSLTSYVHMLDTLMEQEQAARAAAEAQAHAPRWPITRKRRKQPLISARKGSVLSIWSLAPTGRSTSKFNLKRNA